MNPELLEMIQNRCRGISESHLDRDLGSAILPNTTPVPFFGEYSRSNVVTISLNPSSAEFPRSSSSKSSLRKTDRTLRYLDQLGLKDSLFLEHRPVEDSENINRIFEGLVSYFKDETWNKEWFKPVETSLNIGFEASYFDPSFENRACHLDISPWTTDSWSSEKVKPFRKRLIEENLTFFQAFLSESQFTDVVLLGSDAAAILDNEMPNIHLSFPSDPKSQEEFGPKFGSGTISVNGCEKKNLYFISFSPSAGKSVSKFKKHHKNKFVSSSNDDVFKYLYREFGTFIANGRNSFKS